MNKFLRQIRGYPKSRGKGLQPFISTAIRRLKANATRLFVRILVVGCIAFVLTTNLTLNIACLKAQELSGPAVKDAIELGKKYLARQQRGNGSWSEELGQHRVGITSLCLLALINSGMTPNDVPVRKGLKFLRSLNADQTLEYPENYQVALMTMALAAAKDGKTDLIRITQLSQRLEDGQVKAGKHKGGWSYKLGPGNMGADNSNAQFTVLALREAVESGAIVSKETWERCQDYWIRGQSGDGGWGYTVDNGGGAGSYGSMSVAGVSSLAICEQMLRTDMNVSPDGIPPCCDDAKPNKELENGLAWLGRNFSVGHNPQSPLGSDLYYIYGVERAGRLSGQRFFGEHDWYREGAARLIAIQDRLTGSWSGGSHFEGSGVLSTSYALLFLSKGLSPVLINKLKYGHRDPNRPLEVTGDSWNRHRRDARNLTELICGLPKWPKLMTSQEVDIAKAVKTDGVNSLLQASVLYFTGRDRPQLAPEELKLLKEYLQEGGFILATPTCQNAEFETGFREILTQILPQGENELKPLPPDHPVYRSEYLLHPDGVPLFGVDFGCRTSVIYSPEDLGCYWDYWAKQDPPGRNPKFKARIVRATQIGVNILAYATGREPPDKTDVPQKLHDSSDLDNVERGLLQIAQIRHDGAWDAAPRALRNLLLSLNQNVGMTASTKIQAFPFGDPHLFQYPILYIHGRNRFSVTAEGRSQIKEYLERGNVLFADACCGGKGFDRGFREFVESIFPNKKLTQIPISHELFTQRYGRDLKKLKRRGQETSEATASATMVVRDVEPYLEGIELDGRYAVIYSKYDISCALQHQTSGNCEGYLPEDAVQLATNVILYSILQDLNLNESPK